MRILHVTHLYYPESKGGTEVYVWSLANALTHIHEVFIYSTYFEQGQAKAKETVESDIYVRRICVEPKENVFYGLRFNEIIDEDFRGFALRIRPDVVHIHHLAGLSLGIIEICKTEFHIPVVFTAHDGSLFCTNGDFFFSENNCACPGINGSRCELCIKNFDAELLDTSALYINSERKKRCIELIDLFCFPSQYLLKAFLNNGIPPDKTMLLETGISISNAIYHPRHYSPGHKVIFGYFGRVTLIKGIHLLCSAFKQAELDDTQLLIYGAADEETLTYLSGLKNQNIEYHGSYDNFDVGRMIRTVDVIIVPSLNHENAPLVIKEAFAVSGIVIAANTGGIDEMIIHNYNGYLFERGNVLSLCKLLREISGNPEMLNKLIYTSCRQPSIEENAARLNTLYEKLSRQLVKK